MSSQQLIAAAASTAIVIHALLLAWFLVRAYFVTGRFPPADYLLGIASSITLCWYAATKEPVPAIAAAMFILSVGIAIWTAHDALKRTRYILGQRGRA